MARRSPGAGPFWGALRPRATRIPSDRPGSLTGSSASTPAGTRRAIDATEGCRSGGLGEAAARPVRLRRADDPLGRHELSLLTPGDRGRGDALAGAHSARRGRCARSASALAPLDLLDLQFQ